MERRSVKERLDERLTHWDKINIRQALNHYFLNVNKDGIGKMMTPEIAKKLLPYLR